MDIKNITSKMYAFSKEHRWLLFLYGIFLLAIIVGANYYIEEEVESSKYEIESFVSIYGDEKGRSCRTESSYTIVCYKLAEIPNVENEDSSTWKQVYGKTNYYYEATNEPWSIIQYKGDKTGIFGYRIEPCAVALHKKGSDSPASEFRELYNLIRDGYNVCSCDQSPIEKKTKYHYIERRDASLSRDTLWYSHYSDKLFFTKQCFAFFKICEDSSKIEQNLYTYIICSVLIETFLFALIWYLRRKLKTKIPSLKNLNIPFVSKPTPISDNSVSDTEYEVLLHKINPINFMNPYDAEKVKVANDLYSALLKSRDNGTIIRMIEEKAKAILKI